MAVTLHRCNVPMRGPHPCWQVQHALDEAGVDYELVKHWPLLPRGLRRRLQAKTGQGLLPAIEFADGTTLREDSKDLIARIRTGELAPPAAGA